MQTNVLLSIKPEFADAIFSGKKKYEFRKAMFDIERAKRIFLYASRPISLIVGEFKVKRVLSSDPESIWEVTKDKAGISKEYFNQYFNGKKLAYALEVKSIRQYEKPETLCDMFNLERPPQSFMYVWANSEYHMG